MATDAQVIRAIEELTIAIRSAMGSSGSLSKSKNRSESLYEISNQRKNETEINKRHRKINDNMDSFAARLSGLIKTSDTLTKTINNFKNIQVDSIAKAKQQSKIAADFFTNLEETVVDVKNLNRRVNSEFKQSVKTALSGGSKFLSETLQNVNVNTLSEFRNVILNVGSSGKNLSASLNKTVKSVINAQKIMDETISLSDYAEKQEHFQKNLRSLIEIFHKYKMLEDVKLSDFNRMSSLQMKQLFIRIKNEKLIESLQKDVQKGMKDFAEAAVRSGIKMDKITRSAWEKLKEITLHKTLEKGGLTGSEIEVLKDVGVSWFGTIQKALPLMLVRIIGNAAVKIYGEVKDIAKVAFETGTRPLAATALSLRLSASEFQRLTAQYKQAIFFGGAGLQNSIKVMQRYHDQFYRITGDPKVAAELNARVIDFTKRYTEGAQDIGEASAQWSKHLGFMSQLTGKPAMELMDLLDAQMQSAEMQEVMLLLNGKEQEQMIKSIQARQEEYAMMGLTAEKATELAVAMEKQKAQTVPSRVRESARLAQYAMFLGMDPTKATRLRMLALTGDLQAEDTLVRELAQRRKTRMEQERQLQKTGGEGVIGGLSLQHLRNLIETETGSILNIISLFTQAQETRSGLGTEREAVEKERARMMKDTAVMSGEAANKFSESMESFAKNVYSFAEDPKQGVKLFAGAVENFIKSVGTLAIKIPSGEAAMLAAGGIGLLGAKKGYDLLKGEGFFGKKTNIPSISKSPSIEGKSMWGKVTETIKSAKEAAINSKIGKLVEKIPGIQTAAKVGGRLIPGLGWGLTAWSLYELAAGAMGGNGIIPTANAASPLTPSQNVSVFTEQFMDIQNEQLQQLSALNKNINAIAALLTVGNKHAEITSSSTKDLVEAYFLVEQKQLEKYSWERAQAMRSNMAVTGVNPYKRTP